MNNAILNDAFLNELLKQTEREIYARITVLTQQEDAIEYIQGRISAGSINIDGKSAIRRSCSLTLVANDLSINEFYWGIQNKFKLEIGILNNINKNYDEIIWFPQGIFLITNFDTNYTTKNYQITIKGKDKMCLLNGEFGGHLPHSTDFGKEEYHDLTTDTVTYTDIPIYTIIQEIVRNFGNELPHNIIINDIEDAGLELLEYRGNTPMYMMREVSSDIFQNATFNSKQKCYIQNEQGYLETVEISNSDKIIYDNLVDLEGEIKPTKIILALNQTVVSNENEFHAGVYYKILPEYYISIHDEKYTTNDNYFFVTDKNTYELATEYNSDDVYYQASSYYYIAKFDYGSVPGYRLTDLTYAGELISNAGDSVVTILDKIKKMLGDFEYFYNLEGKFVFQKKKNYNASNWHSSETDEVIYNDYTINMEKPIFSLLDNELITSFKNSPKITDLKNDYSLWGNRKTLSGTEIPIHARYAIDIKPKYYKSWSGHYYITERTLLEQLNNIDENLIHYVDWREVIYQMALDYRRHYHEDDFLYNIGINNPDYYPSGVTGYERYYIDLEGFWRTLYDIDPKPLFTTILREEAKENWIKESLYISNSFRKLSDIEKDELLINLEDIYILNYDRDAKEEDIPDYIDIPDTPDIIPFLGSEYCHLNYNADRTASDDIYFYVDENNIMNQGTDDIALLNKVSLIDIYMKSRGPFITLEGYDENTSAEKRKYFYVKEHTEEDEEGGEGGGDTPPVPPEETFPDNTWFVDNKPFKSFDGKLFLLYKELITTHSTSILKNSEEEEDQIIKPEGESVFQFWVFKYPLGTQLGEYSGDYISYAGQAFEDYLNREGWDNLYIKTSESINFDNLDDEIKRLYYKETGQFTDYLNLLQFNNFNELKINYESFKLEINEIDPSTFTKKEDFIKTIKDLSISYVGKINEEALEFITSISELNKKDYENEEEYKAQLNMLYNEYVDLLNNKFTEIFERPKYKVEPVQYQKRYYNFNIDPENGDFWSKTITESPEELVFWFDFINGDTSYLSKYSIQSIGARTKVVNDKNVKAIYYKEVPNTIFITSQQDYEKYSHQTGYTYIQLPSQMESVFVTSSRGQSAKSAVEDLIYKHCYATETATIQTVPIYHLQPNTCIYIRNDETNINGDYLISKITVPLDQKKMMSITTTKVMPNIV